MGIVLLLRRGSCRPTPWSGRCRVVVYYTPGRMQVYCRPLVPGRPSSARLWAKAEYLPFNSYHLGWNYYIPTKMVCQQKITIFPRIFLQNAVNLRGHFPGQPFTPHPGRLPAPTPVRLRKPACRFSAGSRRAFPVMPCPEFSLMVCGHTMVLSRSQVRD